MGPTPGGRLQERPAAAAQCAGILCVSQISDKVLTFLQLHQVHLLQNNLKDLQLQVDVEQRSMARRLDTAITDRCYELLYKVQDLSGKLKAEKRNLLSLESTVRDNLKKEFQTQVRALSPLIFRNTLSL